MIERASTSRLLPMVGLAALLVAGMPAAYGQSVFVNELHYDNDGTDTGETIELAGPSGTDLTGWSLVLYNGSEGAPYNTVALSGVLPDQQGGFGTLSFPYPSNGIQNGAPDGVALVNAANQVVQFISYEGTFTAVVGPANGMLSTDIGVAETSTTASGFSLQLKGTGVSYTDFTWHSPVASSFGGVNADQVFQAAPPVPVVTIPEIQGAGHASPLVGQKVKTSGVVTLLQSDGFYLQDAGDGDPATSDGVLVFTGSAPKVVAGDRIEVVAKVTEYVPGGASSNNLSTTELTNPMATVLSSGNPLPTPVLLGAGGRAAPTETIEDDGFATFDPAQDGIDFYESLEGMLVRLDTAAVVAPRNDYGEIYVVPEGVPQTSRNARGGITVTATDANPERIQLDDSLLPPDSMPSVTVGDVLGNVQGVMSYSYGSPELLPTAAPAVIAPSGLQRETTPLQGSATTLSVSGFNVENLDPGDGARIDALGDIIANRLHSPDILALQEVQDGNGATNDGLTDASASYGALVQAIAAAGGASYAFRDIAPMDNQDGGEPGGNIRVGFLFRPDRVTFVDRGTPSSTEGTQVLSDATGTHLTLSPGRIDPQNAAFTDSRKPLAGEFVFADRHRVFVINSHFASKGGSSPTYGSIQPPIDGGSEQRQAQADVVNGFVRQLLASDPAAKVVTLGDLNDHWFSAPLDRLRGSEDPVLTNLHDTLPVPERYTYVFEGNAQTLDHVLVTNRLRPIARYDIVHVNAEFADQASDHDPSVALFKLPAGDLTGDGRVDICDLQPLVRAILKRTQDTVSYDFNNDGKVNACDIPALLKLMKPRKH